MIIIAIINDEEPMTVTTIINIGFDKIDYFNTKTYAECVCLNPGAVVLNVGAYYVVMQKMHTAHICVKYNCI